MALSNDVQLPKEQLPRYPDRCVSCGCGAPTATFRVRTRAIGWWSLTSFAFGRTFQAEAPACVPCAGVMGRRRWRSRALTVLLTVLGFAVAVALLGDMAGPGRRYLALGVVLLVLAPHFLAEVIWPPAFDVTAFRKSVDYEFADAAYAHEFAELNGGEVT